MKKTATPARSEYFSYVVGYRKPADDPHYPNYIGAYAYGTQLHYGTQEDADGFLEYVKSQDKKYDWEIIRVG